MVRVQPGELPNHLGKPGTQRAPHEAPFLVAILVALQGLERTLKPSLDDIEHRAEIVLDCLRRSWTSAVPWVEDEVGGPACRRTATIRETRG